jgi:hypothetical protein
MRANFHWSEDFCVSSNPDAVADLRRVKLLCTPHFGRLPVRAAFGESSVDDFNAAEVSDPEPCADFGR